MMKTNLMTLLGFGAILFSVLMFFGITSCSAHRQKFLAHCWQTNIESIQNDRSGVIASCEEKLGDVFVVLVDKVGDSHEFLVKHPGLTNKQTFDILMKKKEDQTMTKPKQTSPVIGASAAPQSEP
jgi:hypothetical protein